MIGGRTGRQAETKGPDREGPRSRPIGTSRPWRRAGRWPSPLLAAGSTADDSGW